MAPDANKELPTLALAIVTLGVIAGVGVVVLIELNTSATTTTTFTVTNESSLTESGLNITNATAENPYYLNVSNTPVVSGSETLVALNESNGAAVLGTLVLGINYTVLSYPLGQFNVSDITGASSEGNNYSINSSYQWTRDSNEASGVIQDTLDGIGDLTGWIGTIVAIVIGALALRYFNKSMNGDGV